MRNKNANYMPWRGWALKDKLEYLYTHAMRVDRGSGYGECWEDTLCRRTGDDGRGYEYGYPYMWGSLGERTVVSYILFVRLGRKPEQSGHVCHNNACINPAHVEEISNWLNQIDKSLMHSKRGDYTSLCPGVSRNTYHNALEVRFCGHGGGKKKHIAYRKSDKEAARVALPHYLDELYQEPPHIQRTMIWQRCHDRLLELMAEVGLYEEMARAA